MGGDRTILRLGTDFKVAVAHASDQFPVDLAIGAGIGVETGDKYSLLTLEPSAVASRRFGMSPSASIVPYAAASFAFQNVNVSSNNQTDFSLPLRLGAELRAIPGVNIVAELQFNLGDSFNDDVGFGAGVNFPF